LINHQKWPANVSSNIAITAFVFGLASSIISFFIFDSIWIAVLMFPSLVLFVLIRNIAEFSKSDNSVYLSIFIEDFVFYLLFFVIGICSVLLFKSLIGIVIALFLTIFITAITSLILFKSKFKFKIHTFKIRFKDFSFKVFRLGVNYTILRGNEFLASFGVRYLGQIYFGDIFVSYAHIMYQFYNLSTLITMAVISGLQSKITIKIEANFNKIFVRAMYVQILKTIVPVVFGIIMIITLFNSQILTLFFTKYTQYSQLLVKVSFTGLLFMIVQPLVYILIYNNKVTNIRLLNLMQYLGMIIVYLLPFIFPEFNEQYWLLMLMTVIIIIQGFFAFLSYKTIK
jgi:hypothetical protein